MELSPEEKQRIYEEEKARHEAQDRVKKEAKAKQSRRGAVGCLVIIRVYRVLSG